MSVTKIHSITATETKALMYIVNPEKTDNGRLVFSFGCDKHPSAAHSDFEDIRSNGTGRTSVLSRHIIISFEGQEVTPEKALELGQELCQRFLKGQYQYVLAVHTDTDNVHCHVIFNNINMVNGKSFDTMETKGLAKSWKRLHEIADEICEENNLSVIKNPERSKGKSYFEWDMNRQDLSWKTKLKWAIDECISESLSFEEFLKKLAERNIEVVYNPDRVIDLKFRMEGQERFSRARTLGWYYETDQIKKRITLCHSEFIYRPRTKIIDTTQRKFLDSYGLNRWADIQNMKEASRVINVLTQLNVGSQKQLETAALLEHAKQGTVVDRLNKISREIDVINDHIMWRKTCKKYKPFYDELQTKSGLFRKSYEKKFATELGRYSEARASLKAAYSKTGQKVPSLEELEQKKTALLQERSEKNTEYQEQKKLLKEVEYARKTLEEYLENERNAQEKKRKKGELE